MLDKVRDRHHYYILISDVIIFKIHLQFMLIWYVFIIEKIPKQNQLFSVYYFFYIPGGDISTQNQTPGGN